MRAFQDSNGDGIGDFAGLTSRLDYLKDLGVTTLWLLPFYPSPLRDDGYDIADYTSIHPDYGTMKDFRRFLKAAHDRDLRVVTELVLNHTSDQHAWFQRARRAPPGTPERDFYVWSDTPERYQDARIIFKDFESSNWTWDNQAGAYYWHRFYSHQPDLNFESPAVREAVINVVDFWLGMGVDGLRLDAVPYLHEREGTDCENLPETHAVLRDLRRHVDEKYGDRMIIGEANQWPEDAVAYFGHGDECHAAFHFPLMPRLFMAFHTEDRFPLFDIIEQTPAIPDTSQWLLFLRNHDELTLEMVTDEERDYMYRVYADDPRARINLGIRRRLAPLLGNGRRQIELMNALLMSLPGTPVLYYGDEIGMGDNYYLGDRNGVRTPMQWSADRNAGFSTANPQRLYLPIVYDPEYNAEAVNVENLLRNTRSLLWWMRRILALRRRTKAFGRGTMRFLHPTNRKILAFVREHEDQRILVVANLSRFAQVAELDLAEFEGVQPLEMFGQTRFPEVGRQPYTLSLGPHGFYWLRMPVPTTTEDGAPPRVAWGDWTLLDSEGGRHVLEDALGTYIRDKRWFRHKTRRVREVHLVDEIPLDAPHARLVLFEVNYDRGLPETYAMVLAWKRGTEAGKILTERPRQLVATAPQDDSILIDATSDAATARGFLDDIGRKRTRRGRVGSLQAGSVGGVRSIGSADAPEPKALDVEQTNTSIAFGDQCILKIVRVLEEETNPDLEVGLHLGDVGYQNAPRVAGHIDYHPADGPTRTLGILHSFVSNEGDTWSFTVDYLSRYFDQAQAWHAQGRPIPQTRGTILDLARREPPEPVREAVGSYLDTAVLLGRRTAELHLAMSSGDDEAFQPEPFTPFTQRALYQSMRSQNNAVFPVLAERQDTLPEAERAVAERVLALVDRVSARQRRVTEVRLSCDRIRIHGDLHLGQVLYAGNDFVFIDFEGEPARPVGERRLKRSPLRDVAGMLRSFDYAAAHTRRRQVEAGILPEADAEEWRQWARLWTQWVGAAFLRGYLDVARSTRLVPTDRSALRALVDAMVLEKAVYEVGYELDNRPDWIGVPLRGLLDLLGVEDRPFPDPNGDADEPAGTNGLTERTDAGEAT